MQWFSGEGKVKRRLPRHALRRGLAFPAGLAGRRRSQGDRVAAYLPNMPETIIAVLATVSMGAIWSSASPDFGVPGACSTVRPDRTQGADLC